MKHKHSDKSIVLGIVILLIGFALLASNFEMFPFPLKKYIFRWEAILIIIGLVAFFGKGNKAPGIILIGLGTFFYMKEFYDLHFHIWQVFWPFVLITIGLVIIFHRKPGFKCKKNNVVEVSDDYLDETIVFGGTEKVVHSQQFKGGRISMIFGGTKLIFSKAKLAEGKNYLELFALFGGGEFIIPEDWNIQVKITPIFGGFSDKRLNAGNDKEDENELIITGTVIFGGGEIKNY
jgi:predicted membrane protein